MNKFNKIVLLFLFFVGTFIYSSDANACELEFKVVSEVKDSYSVGDEVVVAVTVLYTHRVCPIGIDATKFNFKGVKVLGATKWKELSAGKYVRKFKMKITEDTKGKHILSATRTCEKDGGAGSISLKVE